MCARKRKKKQRELNPHDSLIQDDDYKEEPLYRRILYLLSKYDPAYNDQRIAEELNTYLQEMYPHNPKLSTLTRKKIYRYRTKSSGRQVPSHDEVIYVIELLYYYRVRQDKLY
jgi:hypothetical protein